MSILKNIINKIFKLLFKKKKNEPVLYKIRKVIFGIRWKLTLLFCGIIILIIAILSFIMFNQQKIALRKEKDKKAVALVRILKSFSEDFLDTSIDITREERKEKYKFIYEQIKSFKKINNDIVAITLVNVNKRIKAHTNPKYLNKYLDRKDVIECLKEEEENKYNFSEFVINKNNYLSITYPIFITKGKIIDVINDFEKYYLDYVNKSKHSKSKLFNRLSKKYDISFNDKDVKSKDKKPKKENSVEKDDIDFLFLQLIRSVIKKRGKRLKKSKAWLLKEKWLIRRKLKIKKAFEEEKAEDVVAIKKEITEKISFLIEKLNDFTRTGGLVILFNMDKIKEELNSNISNVKKIALIMIIVSMIITFVVINFIVLNIKKLEKGSIILGRGNLNVKVDIKSRDELGRLSDVFNLMVKDIKEKFNLEKFVSTSTKTMIKKEEDILLGDIGRKELAFLFSDIRSFTPYTESKDPKEVIKILNNYFELQSKIIKKYSGDIDDFVGDAIMAHFSRDSKVDDAICAAIGIIKTIQLYNKERKKRNMDTFDLGIGLHTGEVIVGNIGSKERMDFAAIGDAVNLASRLCSAAQPGTVLITEKMLKSAMKKYKIEKTEQISIKGKSHKIKICKLKI